MGSGTVSATGATISTTTICGTHTTWATDQGTEEGTGGAAASGGPRAPWEGYGAVRTTTAATRVTVRTGEATTILTAIPVIPRICNMPCITICGIKMTMGSSENLKCFVHEIRVS